VPLYSDDLDATVAVIKDAGGTIAEEPYAFPGERRFTFFDPSGKQARRMEHNLANMRLGRSDQGEC
jgi:predicted enzyme related to lactoylglutathione lyase